MSDLQTVPTSSLSDYEDYKPVHLSCPDCLPVMALCGKLPTSKTEWMPEDTPASCLVCEDIALATGCPRCGLRP